MQTEDYLEVILDQHRLRKREEAIKQESHILFQASSALSSSNDKYHVLVKLMNTLKNELRFDDAFILLESSNQIMQVKASTNQRYESLTFPVMRLFKRVLYQEKVLVSYNIRHIDEWRGNLENVNEKVTSALHIPINGSALKAILVCVHHLSGFFSQRHKRVATHLFPVIKQAIVNLESQENLMNEIQNRIRAEQEIKSLQAQMLETAYNEGFAEHAVSVLHNIGNLITPLKVRLDLWSRKNKLDEIIDYLAQAKQLLNSEKEDEYKVSEMKKFLDFVHAQTSDFATAYKEQVKHGLNLTERISSTISSQQKYADMKTRVRSQIDPIEIIEDTLDSLEGVLMKNQIFVAKAYDSTRKIKIEKNGFQHTLLNLLTNAVDSISEKRQFEDFQAFINISVYEKNDINCIEIEDNGVGIKEGTEDEIFQFGFTTKKKGSGFGLHSCANFLKSHNGVLKLENKGRLKGVISKILFAQQSEGLNE